MAEQGDKIPDLGNLSPLPPTFVRVRRWFYLARLGGEILSRLRFIYQLTGANGLLEQLVKVLNSAVSQNLVARNEVVLRDKP